MSADPGCCPVRIGDAYIHPMRLVDVLAWMDAVIASRSSARVMYCNVHAVNLTRHDPRFRVALNSADLTFCDGQGVRLAAALLGQSLPERFTPPDWFHLLAARCAQQQYRLFLLGATVPVVQHCAEQLSQQFPGLQVTAHHGYFDVPSSTNEAVLELIHATNPHILLVGMGMPRQELWVHQHYAALPPCLILTVGALFDYLTDSVPRGPRWLTDNGFEWLCRLWFEPRRLWRRYLLGNPAFAWLIIRQLMTTRGLARRRHDEAR